MTTNRLTKAQRRELLDIRDHGPLPYADHYLPTRIMLERGLIERQIGARKGWYAITPAGRAALQQENNHAD